MKRVVVKVSGESLKGDESNIDPLRLQKVLDDVRLLKNAGYEVVLVPGGGNIWRGRNSSEMDNVTGDEIGMLSTVMNGLAIASYLRQNGVKTYLCGAFAIDGMVNKYNAHLCLEKINEGYVIVSVGGVGMPFTTTDFACVERAVELKADLILLGKNIDGVYDKDPRKYSDSIKYDEISHQELLMNQINNDIKKLGVIDVRAMSMLAEYNIDTILYKAADDGALQSIVDGGIVGTLIRTKGE